MALQDGMVKLLQNDAAYSSLVSANSTVPMGVVKPGSSPTYPIVVYHQGTILDELDTNGSMGYRTARVQFDAYSAKNYTEAKAVAKAIRNVFKNLNNTTLPDIDSTFVSAFWITMESDLTVVPAGALTVEYRVMVEITVSYKESPSYAFTLLASDNFHRANEQPLNPATWTVPTGQPALAVIGNVCVADIGGYGYEGYTGTSFPSDQYMSLTVSSVTPNSSFYAYVRTDLATLYTGYQLSLYGGFGGGGAVWVLTACANGSFNSLTAVLRRVSSGDVITLAAVGTTIFVMHNGVQVMSATDNTGTSGLPVLGFSSAGSQTDTSLSLFQAGSVAAQ